MFRARCLCAPSNSISSLVFRLYMDRHIAIDLSDDDISLSSSAQDLPHDDMHVGSSNNDNNVSPYDALSPGRPSASSSVMELDDGYDSIAAHDKGYQEGMQGYVLMGNGLEQGDGESDSGGEEDDDNDASEMEKDSVLAVGSGSLVSAVEVSAIEERRVHWGREYVSLARGSADRTRVALAEGAGAVTSDNEPDEEFFGRLERVIRLDERTEEERALKYGLALEMVDDRMRLWRRQNGGDRAIIGGGAGGEGLMRWSCVREDVGTRVRQLASTAIAEKRGGAQEEILERLQKARQQRQEGDPVSPEHLATMRALLKHQQHVLEQRRVNWNEKFQSLLDLPEQSTEEKIFKYSSLSQLARDFTFASTLIAKLIVNELSLPVPLKTVKPSPSMGGQAGGTKYVVNAILFKLAVDSSGLYRGDHFAQKAAGHELKSLAAYFDCRIPGLHVPLTCLVDYRGHRILAMSVCPINHETIVYGSDDGGRTVHDDNPLMSKKMRDAASLLNLAGHMAGVRQQRFLYSPCDIEGHCGRDKRLYVVDFARVFPPEMPRISSQNAERYRGAHLYRLLRPELVKQFPGGALSSDAFSGFGGINVSANRMVKDATLHLFNHVIPAFAKRMDKSSLLAHPEEFLQSLSNMLHRDGINVRFLGKVRHCASDGTLRSILLAEMVARTVKHHLWTSFRNMQATQMLPSEEPYRKVALENLNMLLDQGAEGRDYWWKIKSDIRGYFGVTSLEPWEIAPDFDLRRACRVPTLAKRVAALGGVILTVDAIRALDEGSLGSFVSADIDRIECRVKSMNVVEISSAIGLCMQAQSLAVGREQEQERLFTLAYRKFEAAANASPSNMTTSRYWALALLEHAQVVCFTNKGRACAYLAEADQLLTDSASAQHLLHATIVRKLASLTSNHAQAASLFCRALQLCKDNEQSVSETVQALRLYAGRLAPQNDAAYFVLNRARATLQELALEYPALSKMGNAVLLDMMDLSDVGLDMSAMENTCQQFIRDADGDSLAQIIGSAQLKYSTYAQLGLEVPQRLMQLADAALRLSPGHTRLLEARARVAMHAAVVNSFNAEQLGPSVRDSLRAAAALLPKNELLQFSMHALKSFFEMSLFVESPYRVRSNLPLLSFSPLSEFSHFLVWNPADSLWIAAEEMSGILARKLDVLCSCMVVPVLEIIYQDAESRNAFVSGLTTPMLAAIVQCKDADGSMLKALGAAFSKVHIESVFGSTMESMEKVAQLCCESPSVSCGSTLGTLELFCKVSKNFSRIERLDLSACGKFISELPLDGVFDANAGTLVWLGLPSMEFARGGTWLQQRIQLPHLKELHVHEKLNASVLGSILLQCTQVQTIVYYGKDKSKVALAKGITTAEDGAMHIAGWCRAANSVLKRSPLANHLAKALYRGFVPRERKVLALLLGPLFHPSGQLNAPVVQMLRKLGAPVLECCVGAYVEERDFDALFRLLCTVDRLEGYDSSSVLGTLVTSMRRLLFSSSMGHFSKFLSILPDSKIPGMLQSLEIELLERLMSYLLETDTAYVETFLNRLRRLTLQNAHTISAMSILVSARIVSDAFYRLSVLDELKGLIANRLAVSDGGGGGYVNCDLLLLLCKCNPSLCDELPWDAIRSFCITNVPGLLDENLLKSVLNRLPDSLESFAIRYSVHPRETLCCLDDAVLGMIAKKFPRLVSFEFDLSPNVTDDGVTLVAQACPQLRMVQLRSPKITDEGVNAFVDHCPVIHTMRLQCQLRDIMMSRIGSQMSNLLHLDLYDCPITTVHGVEKLVANSSCVYDVRVQDCRQVRLDLVQVRNLTRVLQSHNKQGKGEFSAKSRIEYKE